MTKGMVAAVHVRPGRLPQDLEALVNVVPETNPAKLGLLSRGIWYAYRRFLPGLSVAEHEGQPVGFLQVGFQRPVFLTYLLGKMPWTLPLTFYQLLVRIGLLKDFEVANIIISPKFQGRGVAPRLMRLAEEEAVQTYYQRAIFLMVRENNKRAVRFYERLGYQRIKTIPVRVGEKLLMRKALVHPNGPCPSR